MRKKRVKGSIRSLRLRKRYAATLLKRRVNVINRKVDNLEVQIDNHFNSGKVFIRYKSQGWLL